MKKTTGAVPLTHPTCAWPSIETALGAWTPKAVIFDWDGLLMNTEICWTLAKQRVFARRGMKMGPEHVEMTFGLFPGRSAEVLAPIVDDDPTVIAVELVEFALQNVSTGVRPMIGAEEAVAEISARVPAAVASNSPLIVLDEGIRQSGFGDSFSAVVAADQVLRPKPHPDLYKAAAGLLNAIPEEILVFEDSSTGIRAANSAGMKVIAVSSRGKLPIRSEDPAGGGAELQFSSFRDHELMAWIRSWRKRSHHALAWSRLVPRSERLNLL